MKKKLWTAILILALAGIAATVLIYLSNSRKEEAQEAVYEQLQEAIAEEEPEEEVEEEAEEEAELSELEQKYRLLEETFGIEIPRLNIDFDDLQENTNEDIYAWLYVPGTDVDYPVLQHPTDNSYYLNNNLDGTSGYPGCIYTELYNSKDFTDFNTVLYGHNMKNGTMFRTLHNFEDADTFDEYNYIYIYLPDDILVYQIFRAYKFNNSHLMVVFNYDSEYGINEYISTIQTYKSLTSNSNDELLESLTAEDRIITLSTCCSGDSSSRYLVQGVLLVADQ